LLWQGLLQRVIAEHEGYAGALTDKRITENNNTNTTSREDKLLERILNRENLNNELQSRTIKDGRVVSWMKIREKSEQYEL